MKKIILVAVIAAVAVLAIEVWAQEIPLPKGIFSGTISRVDPDGKGFFARNEAGEFFQWNRKTRVIGPVPKDDALISENLKEGMLVTIFYTELKKTRIASQIEVKKSDIKTMKGWEYPFGCGLSLC